MAKQNKRQNEKVKKIKRINERRTFIEKQVNAGKLPREFLDQFEAAMRSAVHDSSLINARGNISHGKKALDNIDTKALNALLKKETAGEAKKKTYKHFEEYRQEQERKQQRAAETVNSFDDIDTTDYSPSSYTYNDYIEDRDYTYDNLKDDPDWYNAMKAEFLNTTGIKSYAEVRAAHEKFLKMLPDEREAALQAAESRHDQQAYYFGRYS